ncbi:MAG: VCBS repeat-containing protein, partial [Planctomycetes bacterium]|nr:VCBS repeat-containing protein [Planctomycetota bacterium]
LGDLDGDGDLDAFVANSIAEANLVWTNDGSGTFTDSGQTPGTSPSYDVMLGDLDGDGDLDAFVANGSIDGYIFGQANRVWINVEPSADFDTDDDVDGFDFLAWQLGLGTPFPNATKTDGDADNDLDVDGDDLTVWENQYGTTPPLVVASVVTEQAAVPSSALLASEPAAAPTTSASLVETASSTALPANTWLVLAAAGNEMTQRLVVEDDDPDNQPLAKSVDIALDQLISTSNPVENNADLMLVDDSENDQDAADEVFEEWNELALIL